MEDLTREEKLNQEKQDLEKDVLERMNTDKLPAANIMVAGITGTGKSTLINAVFGSEMAATGTGRPVTDHIDEYHDIEIPIRIWDTVGLELDSEKTKESIRSIKQVIVEKSEDEDKYNRIHAIWYCINSGSSRYQSVELEFIKQLYSVGVPFIIVLTQCSGDEDEVNRFEKEIRSINKTMNMPDIDIVQVLALPVKFRGMSEPIPAFGLEELVDVTLKKLPGFIKSGFVAAQRISKSEKRLQCEEIIYNYVEAAQKGFWDRVPLINVFVTDNNIMKMFSKLGGMYNTVLSSESVNKIMSECNVDWKNNFWGLISPLDMGYSKKVSELLDKKKKDGFEVKLENLEKNERAARMIAFYGYTFIDSIEVLWAKLTEKQLQDVDFVVQNLISIINRKLRERVSGNK